MTTTLRSNGIQMGLSIMDVTGSAPSYPIRAWCAFNGTVATNLVVSSQNISTIVRSGTGVYDVTFITAMPYSDYAVVTGSDRRTDPIRTSLVCSSLQTTTGFRITTVGNSPGEDSGLSVLNSNSRIYFAVMA